MFKAPKPSARDRWQYDLFAKRLVALRDIIGDADDVFGEAYARQSGDREFDVSLLASRIHSLLRLCDRERIDLDVPVTGDRAREAELQYRLARIDSAPGLDVESVKRARSWFLDSLAALATADLDDIDFRHGEAFAALHADEALSVWTAAAIVHAISRRIHEHRCDATAAAIARRNRIAILEQFLAAAEAVPVT